MSSIIVALIIGILIGSFIKPTDQVKKVTGRFQFIGVTLLLFSMGAGLGLNKDLLNNLRDIGITGFLFATLTTLFSIIIVYLISSMIVRRSK